tara:strand:- start:256 stop:675 length:420 start_codon:yes stop_codon:yes gene_type:complete
MRGVVFRCAGMIKALDKKYFYVIANGITRLAWSDIHSPANMKVIQKVKKKGADSVEFQYALDAIPSKRNRRALLESCYRVMHYGASIEFQCDKGNGSGVGEMVGVQWQNNHTIDFYLPEIEKYFNIVSFDPERILAIKD